MINYKDVQITGIIMKYLSTQEMSRFVPNEKDHLEFNKTNNFPDSRREYYIYNGDIKEIFEFNGKEWLPIKGKINSL